MNFQHYLMHLIISVIDDLDAIGILHRDISIDNIIIVEEIGPDGNIMRRGYLIDFDHAIDRNNHEFAAKGKRTVRFRFM